MLPASRLLPAGRTNDEENGSKFTRDLTSYKLKKVVRCLQDRKDLKKQDADWGAVFESFIFHELKTYSEYRRLDDLSYWRSTSGFEVDFIINNQVAVEVKSCKKVNNSDFKGLKALQSEGILKKYILISNDPIRQKWDSILAMPYDDFLQELWNDQIVF
ncbi:MAG: DUF4143 domain-containing protein [Oligoflexia bacterium]|nr:DUF4143 domain-containing protein [Oligoflexia bacterium]